LIVVFRKVKTLSEDVGPLEVLTPFLDLLQGDAATGHSVPDAVILILTEPEILEAAGKFHVISPE